jgi:hypothetical protein
VKNFPKFVDILGTRYKINYQTEKENDGLLGCRGYCEFYTKEIFVNKKAVHGQQERRVLRKLQGLVEDGIVVGVESPEYDVPDNIPIEQFLEG